ncbi:MAG: hypothetical protein WA154_04180 [Moraxellaceae bacterium]
MSYDICIWDPYAFARPKDYIPTDLAEAEDIRFALDWDEDEHLTDPRPMLPENPKFAAFLADLQEVAKQKLFSDLFRNAYADCMSALLEEANHNRNHYFLLPSTSQFIASGEHYLAIYGLLRRHRLAMFDQDAWRVMLPDGRTLPADFVTYLPSIEHQLKRNKRERLTYSIESGELPQLIETFATHFTPIVHAHFENQGYQLDPTSIGVSPEAGQVKYTYLKNKALFDIRAHIMVVNRYDEYHTSMSFSLFVPSVEAYFKHVADSPSRLGLPLLLVKDQRLRSQRLEAPVDVTAYLASSQPMLDFLDQMNCFEQLWELWLKPDPLNPDASSNQLKDGPYTDMYIRNKFLTERTLKALILMRLMNQPEKYGLIIEHLYRYALTSGLPEEPPSPYHRSKRYPKKSLREVFLLDWATLTELLDRDYPPSTD